MENRKESARAFFQQSAWIGIASAGGGVLMALAHKFAKAMGQAEYGVFGSLLQAWTIMAIPSLGVQAVFTQFAVSAEALGHRAVLAGAVRTIFKLNVGVWVVFGFCFFFFRQRVEATLGISGVEFVAVAALVPPASAFLAIFMGVLQGEQDFAWYGSLQIVSGAGRLLFVAVLILAFGARASSAAGGVLFGFLVTLGLAAWKTRSIWGVPPAAFRWTRLVGKILVYTAALGSGAILLGLDTVTVKKFFSADDAGIYSAVGLAGRVLVLLGGPLIVVMYPKVARSNALAAKSSALTLTLCLTGFGAFCAAVFLTLFPKLPIHLLQGDEFLAAAPFIPLYSWSLIPLSLANVLLYNLLARERYVAVPFLVLIAGVYWWRLSAHHGGFVEVIRTMCLSGVCYLAVAAFFTWFWRGKSVKSA